VTLSWASRSRRVVLVLVLTAGAAVAAVLNRPDRPTPLHRADGAEAPRPNDPGELIIAATGDTVLIDRLPVADPAIGHVAALLRRSSIAITNFELTALAERPRVESGEERWPTAASESPNALRVLGFNAVSLANNHVYDYGVEGMRETRRLLEQAGVIHAGTGNNLEEARAAATIETAAGPVAFISVAASHAPIARASPGRGEIVGRPGLNPLRYSRRVTVDPSAFAVLRDSFTRRGLPEGATITSEGHLNLFGTIVRRGERTAVDLVEDPADVADVTAEIARAGISAAAIVVAIHAHEPSNLVDGAPEFLMRVARKFIDAGADLVVGHGPHRLRGIEIYENRPILYSLGNFIFQDRAFHAGAADIFEDATQTMLAGIAESTDERRAVLDFDDAVWWQSVVARAVFRNGEFVRLELHPIDLGVGQPKESRGLPRLASPATAPQILERLLRLSQPLQTRIEIRDGVGVVHGVPRRGEEEGSGAQLAVPPDRSVTSIFPASRSQC
jgi:poly-gamma-glutamate capsule biosynthesis protein CapA/YwtB (metallophosphatase superfamily)